MKQILPKHKANNNLIILLLVHCLSYLYKQSTCLCSDLVMPLHLIT